MQGCFITTVERGEARLPSDARRHVAPLYGTAPAQRSRRWPIAGGIASQQGRVVPQVQIPIFTQKTNRQFWFRDATTLRGAAHVRLLLCFVVISLFGSSDWMSCLITNYLLSSSLFSRSDIKTEYSKFVWRLFMVPYRCTSKNSQTSLRQLDLFLPTTYTVRGKVMFSQVFVCPQGEGVGILTLTLPSPPDQTRPSRGGEGVGTLTK